MVVLHMRLGHRDPQSEDTYQFFGLVSNCHQDLLALLEGALGSGWLLCREFL